MTMSFVISLMPILVIVTTPLLLIFGYKYKIKYLYPKTPLGRTMYIVSSIFSGIVGFASLSIYNYANNTAHIIEGIVYALIGYSFAVFGLTTFFITGMRRTYDIGLSFWIYPIYLLSTFLAGYISTNLSEFLLLGIWVLFLCPGQRR